MKVRAWKEVVKIPTYGIGKPEKNPIFLEKRVYQGSSGVVYPHPVIEKILDKKELKEWNAVFLENTYLRIMILPELGGRIQMAYDKVKNRHFVYYNQVIKPALVGLTGPWISGGIEFNWPQHHRPGTYEPVDYAIEENEDGSVTVWCSEVERMFRTKGMAGFTLYPDKAFLEIKVKLFNRTPYPQTFLWWANPAVHVNDDYQSVFPPDVNAVFDHGKRDVSSFPIATGTYYKVDYSAGVDISKYKNIPVPTSYMAITSKYNFVGGYENDTQGGMLHVANHHVSPGKKQWTWGNGDFGKAWERNLTDEDGPYIELMCGVYTDNQPDFSWIMPYEEKSFNQYFMPYHDIGTVKNATKEALVNLEFADSKASIKVHCTGVYHNANINLKYEGNSIFNESFDFTPENSFIKDINIHLGSARENYELQIVSKEGKVLVSWIPEKDELPPIPEPAKPAPEPKEINSIEQLYLTGLHLEQYRHATYAPEDYYREALRREPGDIRNNNSMGLLQLRKGKFSEAENFFRKAISTLTERNPNPYDGEPFFNLGLCLRYQNRNAEAIDSFYKAVWNAAWQDAGYFNLAQLAAKNKDYDEALDLISRSLIRNWHNHKARHLKAAILRKLGRVKEAKILINESISIDFFNFGARFEKVLLEDEKKDNNLKEFRMLMRNNVHSFIEYSLDYFQAGMTEEAMDLLETGISDPSNVYPMAYYLLGWFSNSEGNITEAMKHFQLAEKMNPETCFPNRLEELLALQCAMKLNPSGPKAPYYAGNYWYSVRFYQEAIECWESSRDLDSAFPTTHRNLSLAYYNKLKKTGKAIEEIEKAFSLDTSDARILMELDQLNKRLNRPFESRISMLRNFPEALSYRDDLYLEVVTLENLLGNYNKALDLLCKRVFHPWEGGEGKVTGQYLFALAGMAKSAIISGDYYMALNYLNSTDLFPSNLGEGKLPGSRDNEILFWKGCVHAELGDKLNATACWEEASNGITEPSAAMFYNDQQPDKIFYQGLALLKLNKPEAAKLRFNKLKEFGEKHIQDHVKLDYFAVSFPDLLIWDVDLQKMNTLHCQYLIGLGELGLGNIPEATRQFNINLETDLYHIGSRVHLDLIGNIKSLKVFD